MHPARQAFIEAFFVSLFRDTGVEVQLVPAADWYLHLGSCPQAKYGWTFPDDDHIILCPQIIALQAGRFDDVTFKTYLDAIGWMASRYLSAQEAPPAITYEERMEALTRIEDELYDLSPPSLAVYSRVQLSVLDS